MTTIVLSPHLDDAVFSCGGMIAQWQEIEEDIVIMTLFAASPPQGSLFPFAQELNDRWGLGNDPVAGRRQEDVLACKKLGCRWEHLEFVDCIYRSDPYTGNPIVTNVDDLFADVQNNEIPLVERVARRLTEIIPTNAKVFSPLGVGGHVDHRITRMAAESLGVKLYYFADFPYAASYPESVMPLLPSHASETVVPLKKTAIAKWRQAIWLYRSQISSFWGSRAEMEKALTGYAQRFGNRYWLSMAAR